MDGSIRDRLTRGTVAVTLTLCMNAGLAFAQVVKAPSTAAAELGTALERTRAQGVPTVVVATSSNNPQSRAFYRELYNSAWAQAHRGLVQVVELPTESNPSLVQNFQIRATPTVVVYVAGTDGVACRGRRSGSTSSDAVAWLDSLRLDGTAAPAFDSGISQARYDGGYPSPQQSPPQAPPPTPSSPPVTQQSFPAQPQAIPVTPQAFPSIMLVPQAAPSAYVNVPGQDIVVQQAQPRIFLAQPAPAMGFVPQAAPVMAFAPQAAPAANLFLPSAMLAPAAMAPVAVPAAAPPAVAAPAAGFAVTNQTVGLSTAGSMTRTRVRGPGPIRYGLSRLGERLVQLGHTRIETIQETVLNTPQTQGGGGMATFSTSSASPIGIPQLQTVSVPTAAPPAQPELESVPTASPQGLPPKHGHLFKKHSN